MPVEQLTFNQKLALLQSKLKPVKKSEVNPHFKSRYADINGILEMVKPLLDECGLILTQLIDHKEGRTLLVTHLFDGDAGMTESLVSEFLLPDIQDMQKIGAAITYARRYAIVSLLCLEAEDDDGNSTSQSAPQPTVVAGTDYASKMVERRAVHAQGDCPKEGCGAPMATSKAGALYCSKKCWLSPVKKMPDIMTIDTPPPPVDDDSIPF